MKRAGQTAMSPSLGSRASRATRPHTCASRLALAPTPTRTRPLGHTRRTCARHGDPPRPPPKKPLRLGRISRGMVPLPRGLLPSRARA